MTNTFTKEIIHDFVSLFFPNYCRACHGSLVKGEEVICSACMLELPRTNYHEDPENPLFKKLTGRIRINHASAFFHFRKGNKVQELLHTLKYKNQPEIGVMLGRAYGSLINEAFPNLYDFIIPVPLHKSRKRKRGYNQSAEFAKGLSQELAIPYSDEVLERVIATTTQTKKSKLNRWENVNEVFNVNNPTPIRDRNILMVDDVVTTGATLEACGHTLLKNGSNSVGIACIAATQ